MSSILLGSMVYSARKSWQYADALLVGELGRLARELAKERFCPTGRSLRFLTVRLWLQHLVCVVEI